MRKENVKISVIVPVYNVERYLSTCMESLVNQTLDDIEIIAVNDGSPDNSLSILEDYQQKYPEKIRVFSIENHGVSYARNYGADRATGDYLLFVDSDDYVDTTICEVLYQKAVADHNDVVICNEHNLYESNLDNDAIFVKDIMTANQNFSIKEFPFELCWLTPFPWDKLVKRELFLKVRFPENIRFEDLSYVLKLLCLAENIGVVDKPLYYYRRTTSGGFLNTFSQATLDIVKAFADVMSFMRENGFADVYNDELAYICARHFFFRYPALFENSKASIQLKRDMIRETHKFLNENFPGWKKNHYLKYSSPSGIKRNQKLYLNERKMLAGVTLFHILPPKIWWSLKKFAGATRRMAQIIKRPQKKLLFKNFKILRLFKMPDSFRYTRAFEKYSVDKKLIFLESKHGEDLAGNIFNFLRILQQKEYEDYRIMLTMTEKLEGRFRELAEAYQLQRVEPIMLRSKKYFKALASAGYLITDTSFPTYFIKKDEQVYLNTWHGTPLKGMGRTVPGREYGQGNVQRNFLIADFLLYQNEFSRDIFLDDYMIRNIFPGSIMLSGYPRNSALFNTALSEEIRKKQGLSGKQLIAYMPTWRGMLQKKDFNDQVRIMYQYLTEIDQKLNDDQIFFVKLHPFVAEEISYTGFSHIRPFIAEYETYDFLNAVDILVTDYSSIMFDFAVTGKKIVLFTYDRKDYLKNRGMYLDLNKVEFPLADTVDELIKAINEENRGYPRFQAEFCCYDSENTAKNVLDTCLGRKHSVICEKAERTAGQNVLIYADGIADKKKFEKIVQDINKLAGEDNHYYFCFQANAAQKNTVLLRKLDRSIGYIPLSSGIDSLLMEYLARWMYLKLGWNAGFIEKRIEKLCRRELKKCFGNVKFDKIIYYYGCSLMNIKKLSYLDGEKICSLMDFDRNKFEKKYGYQSGIRNMVTRKVPFDVFCINEDFSKTDLYQKTKNDTNYQIMTRDRMTIHALMEGKH
ncbi:MAG: bifunctional glycosyltransferase/CDP-glycerol:glycerophosphate glycerophosphotransferase [Ruminococcus sp.]|jgi:CDP-glycerol glycerophosphotransferase